MSFVEQLKISQINAIELEFSELPYGKRSTL